TVLPRETWPSPHMTTLQLRRTDTMVVKGEISTLRGRMPGMLGDIGAIRGFSTARTAVRRNARRGPRSAGLALL
ncbi:hypothetical protein, partial [Stenotrophomonas maltophilia]|uniref:hypothetical protein n=1 Tax=Stenotrophomonas maltophilia TaxID=40324 RepID=UPI003D18B0CD